MTELSYCKFRTNSFEYIVNIECCKVESNKILIEHRIIPYKIPYEAQLNNVQDKFNNLEWWCAVVWEGKESLNIQSFTPEYYTAVHLFYIRSSFSTLFQLAIKALQTVNILLQMLTKI